MGKKKGGGGEKKPKAEKEGSFKWYVDERYEGERNATQQYEGRGTYSYTCGGVYTGMWKADQREGHGIYTSADGSLTIAEYRRDVEVEEGVQLSPDRKQAWRRRDGTTMEPVSLLEAEKIARRLGEELPEVPPSLTAS